MYCDQYSICIEGNRLHADADGTPKHGLLVRACLALGSGYSSFILTTLLPTESLKYFDISRYLVPKTLACGDVIHAVYGLAGAGTPPIALESLLTQQWSPALPSSLLSVSISASFITNFDAPRLARIRLALHGEDMEAMVLEGGRNTGMPIGRGVWGRNG
ncbi:predicted protein [Postia placenta Mad-698-R]|uniref:Uncharacterized protein n=1 Tax=Postia placenta MAD-698-R-SB12 TaxID=670580 RepID=A0A1X6N3I5_9APHY|nr:hypothetical protein POSPLADRAFT_1045603 [Postia placenta MAD-698-R-SB12]EED85893.1 predicted protein [Postia placenta Mad-698-R]OSX63187.1 hypothetical protein POSPLADRAFT_1045603 [Postia placenta MAD-698-R-SB12]